MSVIIEFCGVPGGGKSTLIKAYANAHSDETALITLDMYDRLPVLWNAGLFALTHPISFLRLLRFVGRHHTPGLYRYSLHLMLRACGKYQKARTSSKQIALIDEGFVHILVTLPPKALSQEEADYWLKRIKLPQGVCLSETGDFHRFHAEHAARHPRTRLGEEALSLWEAAVRANVAQASIWLKEHKVSLFKLPERSSNKLEETTGALHTYLHAMV